MSLVRSHGRVAEPLRDDNTCKYQQQEFQYKILELLKNIAYASVFELLSSDNLIKK